MYESHGDAVYRVALRITASSADAYDITHDVFLGLSEAVARYDPTRSFAPWLRGVAVRTSLMRMRSQRRRREVPLVSWRGIPVRPRAGAVVDRITLEKALADLPPELRTVFVLREIEGLTYREIAEVLSIRENTAAVRLHRARRRLRDLLRGDR